MAIDIESDHEMNFSSSQVSCIPSDTIKQQKRVSEKSETWQPDVVSRPKFCPKAIAEYLSIRSTRNHSLIIDVRGHLRFLGWKIEYVNCKGVYRYISPAGKLYLSLRQVCRELGESSDDVSSEVLQDGQKGSLGLAEDNTSSSSPEPDDDDCRTDQVSGSSDMHVVETQYCPEAVVYWYNHGLEKKRKSNADMLSKAKKHLAFMGWSFWYARKGNRRELRYTSPSGTVYNSLRTACKGCIDEGGVFEGVDTSKKSTSSPAIMKPKEDSAPSTRLTESSNASQPRKRGRKRNSSHLGAAGIVDESVSFPGPNEQKRTCALRSSKRARPDTVLSSSNSKPRTILSWLIDNNVVLPRAKVHYRGRNGPLAKGQIGRDGIKCDCCSKVFTLSGFEAHAGSQKHRPTANIILDEDGKSLLDCQKQILFSNKVRSSTRKKQNEINSYYEDNNDVICSICRYGGELILCDNCPSSFHQSCLGLKDLPNGNWFCASCCCGICGKGKFEENTEHSIDDDYIARTCDQCHHKFHKGCMKRSKGVINLNNCSPNKWFCSDRCESISSCLDEILGKPFPLGVDNLTWRLLKSMENEHHQDAANSNEKEVFMENQSKLSVALEVMHECFEPLKDVLTGRDLAEDVIFNRSADLNRLNFQGFYTMLLERNEEVISAGTVRIYENVAEIPLVATRAQYRRHGMCRILMNELEKLLIELGVERLVLPAAPDVLHTWTTKFGFSKLTDAERLQYLGYSFLDFQDTTMCQKFLRKISLAKLGCWLPWKQQ